MEVRKRHQLNPSTIALIPETVNGRKMTLVFEGFDAFYVDLEPIDILELSLNNFGTSLVGAITGSKTILTGRHMVPIVVNEKLNMFWFPTKGVQHYQCVWFSYEHIRDIQDREKKQTFVVLDYGHSYLLNMSSVGFRNRHMQCYELKKRLKHQYDKMVSADKQTKEKMLKIKIGASQISKL